MKQAAGGVVFDDRGRVLVRRPRGGFGGYAWTFAVTGAAIAVVAIAYWARFAASSTGAKPARA